MSSDPAMADGLNWYRYAGNNPIMYTDPTGLYMWPGYGYGKAPPGHKKDEGSRNKESESNDNSNGESDSESSEEDNSSSESNNNTSGNYDPATRENGDGSNSPAWQNPDGSKIVGVGFLRGLTRNEMLFLADVFGGRVILAAATTVIGANPQGDGAGVSLRFKLQGLILIGSDGHKREYLSNSRDAMLLAHEFFHQIEYTNFWNLSFAYSGHRLITEAIVMNTKIDDPYAYGEQEYVVDNASKLMYLWNIPTLEGQAELAGNYAQFYYMMMMGVTFAEDSDLWKYFKQMHYMMGNSGYRRTRAWQAIADKYDWGG